MVIVDNRPGGGGAIAGRLVANANPDGYTLYMPSGTIIAANPHIYPNLPYDPQKDLVPISIVATSPQVIVVRSDFPAKSVKDLIALAKAKPNTITFSSAGVGSQTHLAAESLAFAAGVEMMHVPYKSGGQSATAVLSGEVNFTVANVPVAVGHVKQGRMRAHLVALHVAKVAAPTYLAHFGDVRPRGAIQMQHQRSRYAAAHAEFHSHK